MQASENLITLRVVAVTHTSRVESSGEWCGTLAILG